jgi:hypothetical protein
MHFSCYEVTTKTPTLNDTNNKKKTLPNDLKLAVTIEKAKNQTPPPFTLIADS